MVVPSQIAEIMKLLEAYSFEAEGGNVNLLIARWLQQFEPVWIHSAIVECLYQGRYKVISVDQILHLWQRRGQPLRHYSREFESIILGPNNLPDFSSQPADEAQPSPPPPPPQAKEPEISPAHPGDPIRPFVPQKEESDLYHRLQAVARRASTR